MTISYFVASLNSVFVFLNLLFVKSETYTILSWDSSSYRDDIIVHILQRFRQPSKWPLRQCILWQPFNICRLGCSYYFIRGLRSRSMHRASNFSNIVQDPINIIVTNRGDQSNRKKGHSWLLNSIRISLIPSRSYSVLVANALFYQTGGGGGVIDFYFFQKCIFTYVRRWLMFYLGKNFLIHDSSNIQIQFTCSLSLMNSTVFGLDIRIIWHFPNYLIKGGISYMKQILLIGLKL